MTSETDAEREAEREAERMCDLIRIWREAGTPLEEIERQIAAMSDRDVEALNDVLAGMTAAYEAFPKIMEELAEYRLLQVLKHTRPAGQA